MPLGWHHLKTFTSLSSKNPDLPYDSYHPFDLGQMGDSECLAEFRVHKRDIPALANHCQQRSVRDSVCYGRTLYVITTTVLSLSVWRQVVSFRSTSACLKYGHKHGS